jgi:hypothetical protein
MAGMSRRGFVQKAGVATAVAWSVPVISTIRPAAAQADVVSPPPNVEETTTTTTAPTTTTTTTKGNNPPPNTPTNNPPQVGGEVVTPSGPQVQGKEVARGQVGGQQLPQTGIDVKRLVGTAGAAVAAGAAAVVASKNPSHPTEDKG